MPCRLGFMFVKNGVKIEREEWDENIPAFCPKQEGRRERERERERERDRPL